MNQNETEIKCQEWYDEMSPTMLDEIQWLEFGSTARKNVNIGEVVVQFLESLGGPSSGFWMDYNGGLWYWVQDWETSSHIRVTDPDIIAWFDENIILEDIQSRIQEEIYEIEEEEEENC